MTAFILQTEMEVGTGEPGYRWTTRWIVQTPDGGKIAPPMKLNEAKDFCREHGWKFHIHKDRLYSY